MVNRVQERMYKWEKEVETGSLISETGSSTYFYLLFTEHLVCADHYPKLFPCVISLTPYCKSIK